MTLPLPILILPRWLYHAIQGAKIFRTQAELAEAETQGWRDSPAAAVEATVEAFPVIDAAMPDDGIVAALEAAEAAVEQGEDDGIEDALEAAEEAIEEVQKVVAKKRKR